MKKLRLCISVVAWFTLTLFVWWLIAPVVAPSVVMVIGSVALVAVIMLLVLRVYLSKQSWLRLWLRVSPPIVSGVVVIAADAGVLLHLPLLSLLAAVFLAWCLSTLWGAVRFSPFGHADARLHRARFARFDELSSLLTSTPPPAGFLLGMKLKKFFVSVRPTSARREIGNLLIVGPTRCGKGLLATAQLLSWQGSAVVNDIKGELFSLTAGYRRTLGPVYVIDPTSIGHAYDPLIGKQTEDEFYASAAHLLLVSDEGDGRIFTQRATGMLTQLFLAARAEGIAPLAYVRHLMRMGLGYTATRLHSVSPQLATQFLDVALPEANLSDRFLLSAWGTLTARLRPLLTETVIRSLTASTFRAAELMNHPQPVTVYFRWKEQDLVSLSPLVRLLWGSLIDELITTYDTAQGKGCQPVLLLVDEAGRTAIPMLADQATTVVGRGIYLWIALQSLSQLETVYGRPRAQVLRDNMDSQIYYRPTDLATAKYLEDRLGNQSGYAHSSTIHEGEETSEGRSERPIPLLTAQEILQLHDGEITGFHRRLPPLQLTRVDWRRHPLLVMRREIPPPDLPILPPLADIPERETDSQPIPFASGYIDPDRTWEEEKGPNGTEHRDAPDGAFHRGEISSVQRG